MKTLYLLRHAKAEPGGKNMSDRQRVLSSRGRAACEIMGAYMKAKGYIPDFVLSSSSARTKETCERVAEAANMRPKHRFEDRLYLATAEEILTTVQQVEATESVMVVGHNPGMHHVSLLLSETSVSRLRMALELKFPTCALSVLSFDCAQWGDIAPGRGKLLDFRTPTALEE